MSKSIRSLSVIAKEKTWQENFYSKMLVVISVTLLAGLLLLTIPLYAPPYTIVLLSSILMYSVISVSWATFCGPSQYFSLGIAAFFGIGIYSTALLSESWPESPLFLKMLIGGLASAVFSLLVGFTTLRIRGMYFAIFTYGLSELLRHFVMWWEVNVTGTVGRWIPIVDNSIVYSHMSILAIVTVLSAYLFLKSRYGLALRSIGDAEVASEHIGVNVSALKIIVFAASCFFIGASGSLIATRWTYIDADFAFDPIRNMFAIMMALFGGMDVLFGPILGAVTIGVVSDVVFVKFPQVNRLLLGLALVIVVLFIPEGLAGLFYKNKLLSRSWLQFLKRFKLKTQEKE